jgi:hypothetical protein
MDYGHQIDSSGARDTYERLSEDEQNAVLDEFLAIGELPPASTLGSCSRSRWPPRSAYRTFRRCSPTVRLSTRRNTSASSTSSMPTISTRYPSAIPGAD